ncbi:MAG TPA: hypothetical protein EYP14_01750 [Planctomycetaceae bacterium]|nr:hypothetical protein [Planctomycetaceae bacterium]
MAFDKAWLGWPEGDRPPYRLTGPVYTDVYTGRILADEEVEPVKDRFAPLAARLKPSNQYRPAGEEPWKPDQPVVGTRRNPLTGRSEPRRIRRYYGCDGGIDYGDLYTMRSGTGAFYDKRIESGTIHIGGVRTGCTNNLIPANGLLNVPAMIAGCTCSYPLLVGLALTPMSDTYEQWAVWGEAEVQDVQRVGINFGAPGDRVTRGGTLWLDWPPRGGPSPAVPVQVQGEEGGPEFFYRHSVWMRGGRGWPWVSASGLRGEARIVIGALKPGRFTVRLYFAEPDPAQSPNGRVFDVALQGRAVLTAFDILREAGGARKGVVRQFHDVASSGTIRVELTGRSGRPVLCGIELVSSLLDREPIPAADQPAQDWPF